MGNQVQGASAQVFVKTEKPYYTAGETVNGVVYVNCLTSFKAQGLYLKIKGSEDTWWRERIPQPHDPNNPHRP